MKIEVLKNGKFTTSGSSVLRLIQNNTMPNLDLIVRESLQNSIDAALETVDTINVNYKISTFSNSQLAKELPEVGDEILQKFSRDDLSSYISIADKNTIGLIGSLGADYGSDSKGQNLAKLIFHIMKPQETEGSGGSRGIGKTVYFRLGVGLVFYYSRIKLDDGSFQERLAGALVENEKKENGLLKNIHNNLGVAFFGDLVNSEVQAMTDKEYIHGFLKIFNIESYKNNETGTVIIIPFINEKDLLENKEGEHSEFWQNSIDKYLRMSVLRWYFPRISKYYPKNYGPRLVVNINGKNVIASDETDPLFVKMNELCEACYTNEINSNWVRRKVIERKNNLDNSIIGTFCFGEITEDELNMHTLCLPNPYTYALIDLDNDGSRPPLIAYTRKPGMVVKYEVSSQVIGNISSKENTYIIGLFTLNSANYINKPIRLNLDEYVRQSEKADHTTWSDYDIVSGKQRVRIISSLNNEIKQELLSLYSNETLNVSDMTTYKFLAKKLGKLLMPDEGFGEEGHKRILRESGGGASQGAIVTSKKIKYSLKQRNLIMIELIYFIILN